MVGQGKTPPGIRTDIDDAPKNQNQPVTRKGNLKQPWEISKVQSPGLSRKPISTNYNPAGLQSLSPFSTTTSSVSPPLSMQETNLQNTSTTAANNLHTSPNSTITEPQQQKQQLTNDTNVEVSKLTPSVLKEDSVGTNIQQITPSNETK